mmetsp:Transcript_35941/g.91541  ORF Transcript_35941/g.91541 Transcript_35941/m.91541 type:complete len:322 (-) Transcript_35941:15-980(-)
MNCELWNAVGNRNNVWDRLELQQPNHEAGVHPQAWPTFIVKQLDLRPRGHGIHVLHIKVGLCARARALAAPPIAPVHAIIVDLLHSLDGKTETLLEVLPISRAPKLVNAGVHQLRCGNTFLRLPTPWPGDVWHIVRSAEPPGGYHRAVQIRPQATQFTARIMLTLAKSRLPHILLAAHVLHLVLIHLHLCGHLLLFVPLLDELLPPRRGDVAAAARRGDIVQRQGRQSLVQLQEAQNAIHVVAEAFRQDVRIGANQLVLTSVLRRPPRSARGAVPPPDPQVGPQHAAPHAGRGGRVQKSTPADLLHPAHAQRLEGLLGRRQ